MSFVLRWLISCRMYDSMSWLTCGQGPAPGPSDLGTKTARPLSSGQRQIFMPKLKTEGRRPRDKYANWGKRFAVEGVSSGWPVELLAGQKKPTQRKVVVAVSSLAEFRATGHKDPNPVEK